MEKEYKVYDEPGSLLLYTKLTQEDTELMFNLIARGKYEYIDLLRGVFKDNIQLLKFLDVMSGKRVQFPARRKLFKTLERVFIYNYCKAHDYTEQSYRMMAKEYNKRVPQVKSLVETMNKFINSGTNEDFEESIFEEESL